MFRQRLSKRTLPVLQNHWLRTAGSLRTAESKMDNTDSTSVPENANTDAFSAEYTTKIEVFSTLMLNIKERETKIWTVSRIPPEQHALSIWSRSQISTMAKESNIPEAEKTLLRGSFERKQSIVLWNYAFSWNYPGFKKYAGCKHGLFATLKTTGKQIPAVLHGRALTTRCRVGHRFL